MRTIDVVFDVICPWCHVGRAQLAVALTTLKAEGRNFAVRWNPFQLNPDMPPGGVDRDSYRTQKFGSLERSRALDAQVADAARAVGLTIRHDRMTRTPNTVDAHRLVWWAGQDGVQDAVKGALLRAYFEEGRDVGDRDTLAAIAGEAGLDPDATRVMLAGDEGREAVLGMDRRAREAGVSGVPSFFLDGHFLLSGAAGADALADALRNADRALGERERTAA